ncbi:mitotic spindle assembly checkpoint protein MAD2B isoform 2-T2 [Pangshura tecta]
MCRGCRDTAWPPAPGGPPRPARQRPRPRPPAGRAWRWRRALGPGGRQGAARHVKGPRRADTPPPPTRGLASGARAGSGHRPAVTGKMTTLTRQDLNFGQVVADVLSEFLEVAVHLILYVREVYPIGIFQKRKKYNVPVQNDVEKVVVVILDKEHHPVERFVFEITQPPLLSISSDSLLSHVEQLLRAFILKISVCDAVLDNNPPGCTFTVLVHTREAATRNMEKIQVIKDFPWILADEQDVHMHDPRLIPLKTMTSDILKMQLYVEERAHKGT